MIIVDSENFFIYIFELIEFPILTDKIRIICLYRWSV